MTHAITETPPIRTREYYSSSSYDIGDWLFFQKVEDGKCTGECFTFKIEDKSEFNNEYKYTLS